MVNLDLCIHCVEPKATWTAVVCPNSEKDVQMKKTITLHFNMLATLALFVVEFINSAITHDLNTPVTQTLISTFYDSLGERLAVEVFLLIMMALICAAVFRHLWNYFIAEIANVREINLNESYAMSFIFVWCTLG